MSVKRILVAGCDEVAMLSAVILARNLPHFEVTVIDAVAPDMRFFAEASGVSIFRALDLAGLNEKDFIRHTSATFSLGTEYRDWAFTGQNFIHSLGGYGSGSGVVDFHHAANKLRESHSINYEDFSLAASAARNGKFLRPHDCDTAKLPFLAAGLQFSLPACTAFLRAHGRRVGLKHVAEFISDIVRDDSGNIVALVTASGMHIEADLYVDCTAKKRLLIGQQEFSSWSDCIPVNACVMGLQQGNGRFPPYSQASTGSDFWLKKISLRDVEVTELHFNTHQLSYEQAVTTLQAQLRTDDKTISPLLVQHSGRIKQFWINNCLAIGESAVVLDRISHSVFAMAQLTLARLLELFPGYSSDASLRAEYNRVAIAEAERLRDYHALHYHLLRDGHPLYVKSENFPSELIYKLRLFKAIGRVAAYEHEPLSTNRWISLLLGMEYWPERYDPVADSYPVEFFDQMQQELRHDIALMIETMPDHRSYLAKTLAS